MNKEDAGQELDASVDAFADKMVSRLEEKVKDYGVKGWMSDRCTDEMLMAKLEAKQYTLRKAYDARDADAVAKCTVDIANLAMMIKEKVDTYV